MSDQPHFEVVGHRQDDWIIWDDGSPPTPVPEDLCRKPVHAKRLQVRMGHSSIQMTLDRYGHLLPQDEDAAVEAMPSPLVRTFGV